MNAVGVILLAGKGTRLSPITSSINKHLLNIYNKPMFYYSLSTLLLSGVSEIVFVCNEKDIDLYKSFFGNGRSIGCTFKYTVQKKSNGIVGALKLASKKIINKDIFLILGDQLIYSYSLQGRLEKVLKANSSFIFTTNKINPEDYGVLRRSKNKFKIYEKPNKFISSEVVIGLYFYKKETLNFLDKVKKSNRNEYEITDFNNLLFDKGILKIEKLGRGDSWLDIGDIDRLHLSSNLIKSLEESRGYLIGCPEEIAFRKKLINKQQLIKLCKSLPNNFYKKYLENLNEKI